MNKEYIEMPDNQDIAKVIEAVAENNKLMGNISELLDQIISVLENIERNTRK
jgi:hypothetical protein